MPRLYADRANAMAARDTLGGVGAEQRLRFFTLVYASFEVDGTAVTTRREAILPSAYAQLGGGGTAHVAAMLDISTRREEAAARCGPRRPGVD